ncbi:uncharacterized protein LOC130137547 [Syzygium oleosum]|uniref:uncharacterized protein LOC130137547 n=1 Tax=Syzygium oleosum TaxID=219896 RepID=UPI0024B9A0E7|nr:uncharacterized protein LOC130137547 [Syzygium oleosum]
MGGREGGPSGGGSGDNSDSATAQGWLACRDDNHMRVEEPIGDAGFALSFLFIFFTKGTPRAKGAAMTEAASRRSRRRGRDRPATALSGGRWDSTLPASVACSSRRGSRGGAGGGCATAPPLGQHGTGAVGWESPGRLFPGSVIGRRQPATPLPLAIVAGRLPPLPAASCCGLPPAVNRLPPLAAYRRRPSPIASSHRHPPSFATAQLWSQPAHRRLLPSFAATCRPPLAHQPPLASDHCPLSPDACRLLSPTIVVRRTTPATTRHRLPSSATGCHAPPPNAGRLLPLTTVLHRQPPIAADHGPPSPDAGRHRSPCSTARHRPSSNPGNRHRYPPADRCAPPPDAGRPPPTVIARLACSPPAIAPPPCSTANARPASRRRPSSSACPPTAVIHSLWPCRLPPPTIVLHNSLTE